MLKRLLTILFFGAVIAIGGLGVDTDAMAKDKDYDRDYDCNVCEIEAIAEDYSCQNYTFDLLEVSRVPGPEGLFDYRYSVSATEKCPLRKLALLELGIEGTLVATGENITVLEPGEGGLGKNNWLQGVPQLQVLSVDVTEPTAPLSFTIRAAGTNGSIGTVAAHTMPNNTGRKSYNNIETCFIDGPISSLVPVDASIPLSQPVILNGFEYRVAINPLTGCPDPTKPINLSEEQACNNIPDDDLPPCTLALDPAFVIGDGEDPKSPTFIGKSGEACGIYTGSHNPCKWVILSGRAYGPVCW
jgi:hypothetical protein